MISMGHSNYISHKNSHTVSQVDNSNTVHHMPVMFHSLNIFQLKIHIPTEGVSSHQILVAPGEGILRHDRLGSGDHFVKVGIGVPKPEVMTRRQRELIHLFSLLESPPENGLVRS